MKEERLLTEAELLAALNIDVDRTAVWRWRQQGMPHVKVGRSTRYNLVEVQAWLKGRTTGAEWPWSVWTWMPEDRSSLSGKILPAGWYEECRCRNQADAENIAQLFQKQSPQHHARAGTSRPEEIPGEQQEVTYPRSEEG